jgi:hypothetical protein
VGSESELDLSGPYGSESSDLEDDDFAVKYDLYQVMNMLISHRSPETCRASTAGSRNGNAGKKTHFVEDIMYVYSSYGPVAPFRAYYTCSSQHVMAPMCRASGRKGKAQGVRLNDEFHSLNNNLIGFPEEQRTQAGITFSKTVLDFRHWELKLEVSTEFVALIAQAYAELRAFSWQLRLAPFPIEALLVAFATPQDSPLRDEVRAAPLCPRHPRTCLASMHPTTNAAFTLSPPHGALGALRSP